MLFPQGEDVEQQKNFKFNVSLIFVGYNDCNKLKKEGCNMKKIAILTLLGFIMQTTFTLSACASYEDNTGTVNLSSMTVTGTGIEVANNTVSITRGGDFTVTGESENAMIYVNAQDKVKLRLSGISLKNESGPAIFFDNAEKALITVSKDTENYVEDGTDYGETDAKAAIFSNDDLEIKGNGSLTVVGNYKHGIASDDDISVENGVINITAKVKDGIHVNNTFQMSGGTLNIAAASDGIQAEEDVVIDGGTINITESKEGIESGTTLTVNGGEINITSTDDGLNSGGGLGLGDAGGPGGFGGRPNMNGNEQFREAPPDGMPQPFQDGERPKNRSDGKPSGNKDFEQIQPQEPPHERGNRMPDNTENFPSAQSDTSVDRSIYINGGVIKINASGDGVDSNASVYMTGGELYVDGPTSNGDGAIDGDRFEVSGGTVVAVGSGGMAMGVATGSEQCALIAYLSESAQADSVISLKDASGSELFEYTAKKAFSSVVYSSDRLKENETYTLLINGEEKLSIEMTAKQVTVGTAERGFHGGKNDFGGRFDPSSMTEPTTDAIGSSNPIKVVLNGTKLMFDSSPVIANDTTLVPFRTIFEALGMDVDWNESTQTVTAQKDGVVLTLKIGSSEADKNGSKIGLLTAPILSNEGRTLVPIRFIAESLNYNVAWDEATRTVDIRS